MKRKECVFKMPNAIIEDTHLHYSSKCVAAVLYRYRNRFGICRIAQDRIARAAHLTRLTVERALRELEEAGYVFRGEKAFVYSHHHKRYVFDQITYACSMDFSDGYTMIPCSLLGVELMPSSFNVALYVFFQMGNKSHAWPSCSIIRNALKMSRATVFRAYKELKAKSVIFIRNCITQTGKYIANSFDWLYRREDDLHPSAQDAGNTRSGHEKPVGFAEKVRNWLHFTESSFKDKLKQLGTICLRQFILPVSSTTIDKPP